MYPFNRLGARCLLPVEGAQSVPPSVLCAAFIVNGQSVHYKTRAPSDGHSGVERASQTGPEVRPRETTMEPAWRTFLRRRAPRVCRLDPLGNPYGIDFLQKQ